MLYQPPIVWDNEYFIGFLSGKFKPHWHREIEIIFCVEDRIAIHMDNVPYEIFPSEAIIINSIDEHEVTKATANTRNLILEIGHGLLGAEFCNIAAKRFVEPIIKFHDNDVDNKAAAAKSEIHDLLVKIISEHENNRNNFDTKWIIKGCLFQIAALLFRHMPMEDDISEKRHRKLKQVTTIQPVLDYIIEAYDREITVPDAASLIRYETKSFCRIFKNVTGFTFHQYLNMYRINQSCMMIESGQQHLGKIAEKCGINSPKSFSRLFRQFKGITPTEYKQHIIKK